MKKKKPKPHRWGPTSGWNRTCVDCGVVHDTHPAAQDPYWDQYGNWVTTEPQCFRIPGDE